MAYNTDENEKTTDTNKSPKGNTFVSDNLGVRDALNTLGYNNSLIGYDGENVTYGGKYLLKPERNDEGTTKASPQTLIGSINSYNKKEGIDDSVVDVTAYSATATKLPYAVTHDKGVVSLGGIPIQNTMIIDGVAYAPRSSIDAAIGEYSKNIGQYTEKTNEYLKETETPTNDYLTRIYNYEPFSYNPDNDAAYLAYKDQYTKNAALAAEDVYGLGASRTGGYQNSAALMASNQAYYDHMKELADNIPALLDNAYKRHTGDFDMLLDSLKLYGTPYDRHKLSSDALVLDREDTEKALEKDYNRDIDSRDFNYSGILDWQDYEQMLWDRDMDSWDINMDIWERDNILTPKSLLLNWEVENIPLNTKLLEAEIANKQADTGKKNRS